MRSGIAAAIVLGAVALVSGAGAARTAEAPSSDLQILPAWHGTWEGDLYNDPRPIPETRVVLTVGVGPRPDDGCLEWKTEYFQGAALKQTKDYQLCRSATGEHYLDEGEGLLLKTAVFGDELYTAFSLADSDVALYTHARIDGDRVIEDILSSRIPQEAAAGVMSYATVSRQRLVLRRTSLPETHDAGRPRPDDATPRH